MLESLADFGRTLLTLLAAVVLLGALAHALGWLLGRRHPARFVWRRWNGLGALLLLAGLATMAYGWASHGLGTGAGSTLVALGLLAASAGLWMLVPI
jgi:hypothetical protein